MDWVAFLDAYSIPFVSRGPNTRRGEISVACPFCGDDPSEHLGISLSSENWGCLRSNAHRGHAPHTLVAALTGSSYGIARAVVAQYSVSDPDSYGGSLGEAKPISTAPSGPVALPNECRAIQGYGLTMKFWKYLRNRGFDDPDLLCALYGLRGCLSGKWQNRLIVPIKQNDEIIGWQGRALGAVIKAPRYLSSSEAVKKVLFNGDVVGDTLFVCEGPFDAMKIDFYGRDVGARAVCTFGVTMTAPQIKAVLDTSKRFSKTVLLFDPDAVQAIYEVSEWLPHAAIGALPQGVKDPGDLSRNQVMRLIGGDVGSIHR